MAYESIRERILRGQLPLGMVLSRRKLALELNMSLLPVAEALQRLEADGLVESRPRAGTRVRVPTEQDIRGTYEVREALESQSARLFSARATAAERKEVKRFAAEIDDLFARLARGPVAPEFSYQVHSRHAHFHMWIAECCRCDALFRLIEKQQVLVRNWLFDVAANRRALPVRFHRDLAQQLAQPEPEAADAAMRAHVRYGIEDAVSNLNPGITLEWRMRRHGRAQAAP